VPIRLALIDLGLRRGDGISLAARLKQLAPTLPLVLMSGDDVARLRGQQFGADFAGYLQKPFTAADLLATVARVLAPGTGTPPGAPSGWRGPHSL
jgi:CheY-like chemotaxis protein